MIKFFRKIREKMLVKNKFSKYLLYAIGEIILVVIGILIALSINNWNENRKNTIEEKAILESLYENLNLAKTQSESLIAEEDTLKERLIRILRIDSKYSKTDFEKIPDSIFKSAVWDLQSDQPTFNAYNNLKNTNKLSLIKSKKINEKFTDLEFHQNKLNDILEDRLSVHQIRVDDILEKEINFIPLVKSNIPTINIENEIQNNYKQILDNKRIRNLLGMKLSFTQDVIDRRQNLDDEIRSLILYIESELNNR
jgi:hypothetical protein